MYKNQLSRQPIERVEKPLIYDTSSECTRVCVCVRIETGPAERVATEELRILCRWVGPDLLWIHRFAPHIIRAAVAVAVAAAAF